MVSGPELDERKVGSLVNAGYRFILIGNLMDPKVVMYSTPFCPYCSMAKRLLKQEEIPFEEINVAGDPERRRWLLTATGQRTVPQIFINGRSIGGFDELSALARRGQLAELLAQAPAPISEV